MPSRTLTSSPLSFKSASRRIPKIKSYFRSSPELESPQELEPSRTDFASLPSPIIDAIGHECQFAQDVLNLSLCSRRIRALLIPRLYTDVELKTNRHCKTTLLSLTKYRDHARHIRRLVVAPNNMAWTPPGEEIDEGVIAKLLTALVPHLRSLESFVWAGWEMPPDELWLALRKFCPNLRGVSTVVGDQTLNPASQLYNFSNLKQFSLSVKSKSLDWITAGPPKVERFPRRLWEMLIERCPALEELSLDAVAPAHRIFDARNAMLGRWPRLRSLTLGDMLLQDTQNDNRTSLADYQAFMKFFVMHFRLEHIALQHAGASSIFPSSFALPYSALPRLISFHGPLRYIRTLPHPEKLQHLTLTSLHHTQSTFHPTWTALQDLPNLDSLSVWVDLSLGGQPSMPNESQIFSSFLSTCPLLRHFEIMCFSRPTFRTREFSRALQAAPTLESFTLTKMYKSSDEDMTTSAIRILQENPTITQFTLQYTQDRWPTQGGGRLRQMGVYHVNTNEYGYPESVLALERKAKTFGTVTSRRTIQNISTKLPLPSTPGCDAARSPRSSLSSGSDTNTQGWTHRPRSTTSQSSYVVV